MYRSILVPLDGSSFSEHALPLARALTRACRARLRLAHVHVAPVAYYADGLPVINAENDLLSREAERDYLERLRAELSANGLATTCVLLEEPVGAALAREAAEREADLVIMTTHGRGGWSRMWLGSVADELMHNLNIPLLLIHPREGTPGPTGEFRRILIALDGSPLAEQILPSVQALGADEQTEYTLLQVIEPFVALGGPAPYSAQLEQDFTERRQDEAEAYLESVARRLRIQGPRVRTRVVADLQVAQAILNDAWRRQADLIALATHGRGGLRRLLVGSVADKVLRGADTPVLLLRPREVPPIARAAHTTAESPPQPGLDRAATALSAS